MVGLAMSKAYPTCNSEKLGALPGDRVGDRHEVRQVERRRPFERRPGWRDTRAHERERAAERRGEATVGRPAIADHHGRPAAELGPTALAHERRHRRVRLAGDT